MAILVNGTKTIPTIFYSNIVSQKSTTKRAYLTTSWAAASTSASATVEFEPTAYSYVGIPGGVWGIKDIISVSVTSKSVSPTTYDSYNITVGSHDIKYLNNSRKVRIKVYLRKNSVEGGTAIPANTLQVTVKFTYYQSVYQGNYAYPEYFSTIFNGAKNDGEINKGFIPTVRNN